jgi:hypothetical protein
MAPGSVELRLRGREPEFVVSLPPLDPSDEDGTGSEEGLAGGWRTGVPGPRGGADPDEPPVARINLRLPDRVKSRVEESAAADGLSVNSWLVRAAAAALERRDPVRRRERNTPHGAQRYTGWSR